MILDFLVDAAETLVTEFDELSSFVRILHNLLADVGHEHISQELKTNPMIVLHDFVVSVLHVLCSCVTNDAYLYQLPMLRQNVFSLHFL